jgi:hypothetical protein
VNRVRTDRVAPIEAIASSSRSVGRLNRAADRALNTMIH